MKLAIAAALAVSACTTLGPMPATTGVSAVPANRPGVEAQVGLVPGFFLSDGAQKDPKGSIIGQSSIVVEPDRLIDAPGLILGARSWGNEEDVGREPMIGYRRSYDDHSSYAVLAYGTKLAGSNSGSHYEGTHAGGEVSFDARAVGERWLQIHVQGTASLSYLRAEGSYCVGSSGYGVDCDNDEYDHRVDAHLSGLFPAATSAVTLDIARRESGIVHSVRIALLGSFGAMPVIRYREDYSTTTYLSMGLTLTLGLGADH